LNDKCPISHHIKEETESTNGIEENNENQRNKYKEKEESKYEKLKY